jgi:hypothetical protein
VWWRRVWSLLGRLRFIKRFRPSLLITVGLLLIAVALLVGLKVLQVDARPIPINAVWIAFESPVPETPGAGVEITTQTYVDKCNEPVLVQVNVLPSAQYIASIRQRLFKLAHFSIAIGDPKIWGVQFRPDVSSDDNALPPYTGQISGTHIARKRDEVVASGIVKNWAQDPSALSVIFLAKWLSHRSGISWLSGESCYASLPTLTGLGARAFALGAFGTRPSLHPRVYALAIHYNKKLLRETRETNASLGRNTLSRPGQTEDDASTPSPSFEGYTGAAWQCQDRADGLTLAANSSRAQVENQSLSQNFQDSLSQLAQPDQKPGGCSALAVVDDTSYKTVQDVALAVIGVLLTFGAQLTVVGVVRSLSPRSARNDSVGV